MEHISVAASSLLNKLARKRVSNALMKLEQLCVDQSVSDIVRQEIYGLKKDIEYLFFSGDSEGDAHEEERSV